MNNRLTKVEAGDATANRIRIGDSYCTLSYFRAGNISGEKLVTVTNSNGDATVTTPEVLATLGATWWRDEAPTASFTYDTVVTNFADWISDWGSVTAIPIPASVDSELYEGRAIRVTVEVWK